MGKLWSMVLEDPDLERNKVVRWRCADLQVEIAALWSVSMAERTVGKLLRRLRMTRLQPRPNHPKKDAVTQEILKDTSPPGSRGVAGLGRRKADRGVVPGRSQGRAEGVIGVYLGAHRLTSAYGTR
jgi:hypothetical protein